MSFHAQFDRLPAFLNQIVSLDAKKQREAIMNETIEAGGTYVPPRGEVSHLFEISLHGIAAYGAGEDEAVKNWIKIASKRVEDQSSERVPPFPHPRNHGEEIANAKFADQCRST